MFQLIIISLTLLFIFIYFNKKTGKVISVLPVSGEEEELIEIPDERAYYDETNFQIIELKKQIDSTGIREEDIEKIKMLKKEIAEKHQEWEQIQKILDQMIEERTIFVSQANFYPNEYVFDINRMKTEKEKAREYQLNNPLKPLIKINSFIKEQNEKVQEFKEIKTKVENMLLKLEIYEKGLRTKKEKVSYFNKKQELFINLQNGELSEVKKILKEFKSKVKHIK